MSETIEAKDVEIARKDEALRQADDALAKMFDEADGTRGGTALHVIRAALEASG